MCRIKQSACLIIIVFFCLSLSGCWFALGGATGASTAIYFKGRLQENIGRDLHTVHGATQQALNRLELPILKDEKQVSSVNLESNYPDGTHVWINLRYLSANTTRVTIRVGLVGDESRSRQIWEEIRRQLP